MLGRLFAVFALLILSSGASLADGASVRALQASELADSVPAAFKEQLESEGVAVTLGEKETAHVWLVKELPKVDSPSSELGISYGQLKNGALIGVLHLAAEWHDYKENIIPAGTYGLRYWALPQDGNHMGVATYRDFLLLTDLSVDTDPAAVLGMESLYEASLQATGVPHPGVLALYPIWDQVSEPTIVENDMGQPTLALPRGDLTLGLIVEGHGEI